MGRDWSLEYDRNLPRFLLHLSHWSCYFLLLHPIRSSHSLRRCCFLPQTLHYLMTRLTLTGQVSDLELHNQGMGSLLHPERRGVTHKQNQLHIDRWNTNGSAHLNFHNLFHLYQSSSLGLGVS